MYAVNWEKIIYQIGKEYDFLFTLWLLPNIEIL